MKEDMMGWVCSIRQINWSEYLEQRYHVEDLDIHKMIIVKKDVEYARRD
jgi:hypothetical protein